METEKREAGRSVKGLVTVTFRSKTPMEILELCTAAGMQGVEWGGDVHVPSGDTVLAEKIGRETRECGLEVVSYGSYYRLGEGTPETDFVKAADTAKALGAPFIRIWAGGCGSAKCPEAERRAITEALKRVCELAAERELAVGLEYHRGTLTDTKESALKLLTDAACPNLYTYWQYNPEITHEERLEELKLLKPYLCAIHVFYWEPFHTRLALADGEREWKQYMELLDGFTGPFLLEFVKDDREEQLKEDFSVLSTWV